MSRYPTAPEHRARKVSVSLPGDLAAYVDRRAAEHGVGFSTELAEIVRGEREADELDRLERALALDAEENERFAREVAPAAVEVLRSVEW